MPYLTQLAAVARRTGYPVVEVTGWRTRGHGEQPQVLGIVAHHTAGATGGGDAPSLAVVRDGRPGLDGPLSHFVLGRSGTIYVVAAGRCWHNAPSTSAQHTNSASLGIEAENDGRQPWPADQVDAYVKLCAELCLEFGLPASRVRGHKEVNDAKPDPHTLSMTTFRSRVAAVMNGEEEEPMPEHTRFKGVDLSVVLPPGQWRYVPFTHKGGDAQSDLIYSVLTGKAHYLASVGIRIGDTDHEPELGQPVLYKAIAPGTEVQLRAVEVEPAAGGGWDVYQSHSINSLVQVAGSGHFTHTWNEYVGADQRLRFRVIQYGAHPVLLNASTASVTSWPAR